MNFFLFRSNPFLSRLHETLMYSRVSQWEVEVSRMQKHLDSTLSRIYSFNAMFPFIRFCIHRKTTFIEKVAFVCIHCDKVTWAVGRLKNWNFAIVCKACSGWKLINHERSILLPLLERTPPMDSPKKGPTVRKTLAKHDITICNLMEINFSIIAL